MAKGDYIERRLAYRDHIYKTAGARIAETVRDYTLALLEDLLAAASANRARYQAELLVAYDPLIELVSKGLETLETRMGFTRAGMLSRNQFRSDWPEGEKSLPELDVARINDPALRESDGTANARYLGGNWLSSLEITLIFSRYPVALGGENVRSFMDATGKEDYRGFHPPIEIAKYHLPDFLTLRRFRKGIRQLPHAKVISTFRHEYMNM